MIPEKAQLLRNALATALRLATRIRQGCRHRYAKVDVTGARKMYASEIQVRDRQTEVSNQLTLDAEAALLDVGLRVVFREQVDARCLRSRRRRRCEVAWISWTRIRHERARKRHTRYLNTILRVGCPQHDSRRAPKEDSVAAAQYRLFIKPVTKAEPR